MRSTDKRSEFTGLCRALNDIVVTNKTPWNARLGNTMSM